MGVGASLHMYDVVVEKFKFATSSPDEFLQHNASMRRTDGRTDKTYNSNMLGIAVLRRVLRRDKRRIDLTKNSGKQNKHPDSVIRRGMCLCTEGLL